MVPPSACNATLAKSTPSLNNLHARIVSPAFSNQIRVLSRVLLALWAHLPAPRRPCVARHADPVHLPTQLPVQDVSSVHEANISRVMLLPSASTALWARIMTSQDSLDVLLV